MLKLPYVAVPILAAFLLIGTEAFGGALSLNVTTGAGAMGKATAFVAEANDPSAIYFNPAGLTQLPRTQLMIGAALVKLDSTFRSSTSGESTQLQDQFPVIPHIYITHRFKGWNERIAVGLGIHTPFGIIIDWPDEWQGRFSVTNARFRATIYNPTIAFQVTPKLSLGAGLQVTDATGGFEQKFNVGNGESKVRVHHLTAHPIGWNVGVLYRVTDTTSAGITFRSELQAKLNGQADFTGPASALFENTTFHTSVKLPPRIVAGISTKVIPRWTINAEIEWQGWNTVGTIQKHFVTTPTSPLNQQLLDSQGLRLWENSYVYKIGGEFAATDRLALRGGYFYDEAGIPKSTFNPTVPTSDIHAFTIGFGYKWPSVVVDAAYLLGFYEERSIDGSTLDPDNRSGPTAFGSYSSKAQVFTVSVTLKF